MTMVEKGGDALAGRYNYTIQGFVAKMKEEPMNEQLDNVLRELMADNADILQWTTNPAVRLCLIYVQALAFTARRLKPGQTINGALQVGPAARAPDLRWGRQPEDTTFNLLVTGMTPSNTSSTSVPAGSVATSNCAVYVQSSSHAVAFIQFSS